MQLYKVLLIWGAIFSITCLDAYIFELQSIKKKNSAIEGPEWVIGLGDLHDKQHPTIKEQKDAIMSFLTSLPKDQVKVLTEDLSSPGSFGRQTCGNFYIDSRGGVLGGSAKDFIDQGFDTQNHEFRYCRVSSLGPVINNQDTDVSHIHSTSSITMGSLCQEIQKELDQIGGFEDGRILKEIYDKNRESVQKKLKKLNLMAHDQTSVADYLQQKASSAKDAFMHFIKKLLIFDSELLDCKFIHDVKQQKEKRYVIIIAGAAHVKRVCDILTKDGYEPHTTMLSQPERTTDEAQCAGQPLKNQQCIAPRAIDLSCLPNCCDLKR